MPTSTSPSFHDLRSRIKNAREDRRLDQEDWLLELAATHDNTAIRRSAIVTLRELGSQRVWPLLISILSTELSNENLRETAIKALGEVGGIETRLILGRVATSGDVSRFGQQAAHKALERLELRLRGKISGNRFRGLAKAHSVVEQRDVFVCHASEDKLTIVEPVTAALKQAGISYWYDDAEILWGDSITTKVNEGLKTSRYVLAVLTPSFFGKHWPERELNSVLNIEAATGAVRLLVLLAGTTPQKSAILRQFPLLNDKLYVEWQGEPIDIVDRLKARLGASQQDTQPLTTEPRLTDAAKASTGVRASAVKELRSRNREFRDEAVERLVEYGATGELIGCLGHSRSEVREAAARGAAKLGATEALPYIIEGMRSVNSTGRPVIEGSEALVATYGRQAVPLLLSKIPDQPDPFEKGRWSTAIRETVDKVTLPEALAVSSPRRLWLLCACIESGLSVRRADLEPALNRCLPDSNSSEKYLHTARCLAASKLSRLRWVQAIVRGWAIKQCQGRQGYQLFYAAYLVETALEMGAMSLHDLSTLQDSVTDPELRNRLRDVVKKRAE